MSKFDLATWMPLKLRPRRSRGPVVGRWTPFWRFVSSLFIAVRSRFCVRGLRLVGLRDQTADSVENPSRRRGRTSVKSFGSKVCAVSAQLDWRGGKMGKCGKVWCFGGCRLWKVPGSGMRFSRRATGGSTVELVCLTRRQGRCFPNN